MPKAYWIAHVSAENADVFGSDTYQAYVSGAGSAFKEYGAKFLARGGEFVAAEGLDLGSRHVVIEFPSLQHAKDCYNSEAYQTALKHRQAVSEGSIILVEGADG